MKLHEFLCLVEDNDKLIDFLISRKVIHGDIKYPRYKTLLKLNRELMFFKCNATRYEKRGHKKRCKVWCNFKLSLLHNTWFSHSHLTLQCAYRLIAYFLMIRPPRVTFLIDELSITSNTVIDRSNFCREVYLYNVFTYSVYAIQFRV